MAKPIYKEVLCSCNIETLTQGARQLVKNIYNYLGKFLK